MITWPMTYDIIIRHAWPAIYDIIIRPAWPSAYDIIIRPGILDLLLLVEIIVLLAL